MNSESEKPEVIETSRQIYAPVIDRCNELLTLVETNYPATHQLRLVDATPGVWESYGAILQSDGLTTATTIVIKDPLHPHFRVTVSEVTHTEADYNDIEISAHLLIITKRPYPRLTAPLLCQQRVLVVSPFLTVASIMNFTESIAQTGQKHTETLNYFFDHDTKVKETGRADLEASLDTLSRLRPVMVNGEVKYYGSFDALSQGNRDKIVAGLMKDGFNKKYFVRDTLVLLAGEPVPLTRYDLETETDQFIQRLITQDTSHQDTQYLQHQLLVLPPNGYPDLPE